jgi:hypothetical protein
MTLTPETLPDCAVDATVRRREVALTKGDRLRWVMMSKWKKIAPAGCYRMDLAKKAC